MIFHEYAIDVAQACREQGVKTVAVTAGEVCAEPRAEFYRFMDAANVDLKALLRAILPRGLRRVARSRCWRPSSTSSTRPRSGSS